MVEEDLSEGCSFLIDYKIFDNKLFEFDQGEIKVDIEYLDVLAPSDSWPGSEQLCRIIVENKKIFENKTLLELGSGTGIAGILASNYAKSPIVLTDGDACIVDFLKKNVRRNNLQNKIKCKTFSWGVDEDFYKLYPDGFDIIIGGDLLYSNEAIPQLTSSVNNLLAKSGSFIMIYVKRLGTNAMGLELIKSFEEINFSCESKLIDRKIDDLDAYLYHFRRHEMSGNADTDTGAKRGGAAGDTIINN